jgi:hypothetical protein
MSTAPPHGEKPTDNPRPSGSPFGKFLMSPVLAAVLLALAVSAGGLAGAGIIAGGGGSDDSPAGRAARGPAATSAPDPSRSPDTSPGAPSDEPPATSSGDDGPSHDGPGPQPDEAYEECVASGGSAPCSGLQHGTSDGEVYLACRDESASAVGTCLRLASDPQAVHAFRSCLDAVASTTDVCLMEARRAQRGP